MTGKAMLRALFVMLVCASALHAQSELQFAPQAEELFLLGVRQFVQQDFKNAYQTLRQAAEMQPMHQRTTAATIMAAKAANALHQYDDAADLCSMFLERYPYSSYVEDAHYTRGIAYAGLDRMPDAAREMIITAGSARVDVTRWRADDCIQQYALSFTPSVIGALERVAADDSTRVLLTLLKGEAYLARGMKDSAAAAAQIVAVRTTDRKLLRRAQRLSAREGVIPAGDTITVGVLLPLMRQYRTETPEGVTAKEIEKGIGEALHEYNTNARREHAPLKLDVRDTQREKERIGRIVDEWSRDSSVMAIIGPLFTDETVAAAEKANALHIPLLTPTATGNNIASIGAYIFQASPDYEMRGALMAQYAVRMAGATQLAVIASDVFPASLLADAFVREAHRLGADIISFQHYSSGTSDFRHLMRAMKTDVAAAKSGGIQAIYCPIASSAEIGVIAPQLRMLDQRMLVLGSDEWNDDEELDRNRSTTDGVIFTTDRWNSDASQPISGQSFESFGYDGASLLFSCMASQPLTRESIKTFLSHVSEYDGIHSKISLQPARVNTHLHVLQYKNGFIKKIDEVEYKQ
jgi:branched-chain amino acid transport system substrate-binding protein